MSANHFNASRMKVCSANYLRSLGGNGTQRFAFFSLMFAKYDFFCTCSELVLFSLLCKCLQRFRLQVLLGVEARRVALCIKCGFAMT